MRTLVDRGRTTHRAGPPTRLGLLVALLVVAVTFAVSCSKSADNAAVDVGTTAPTTAPSTTAAGPGQGAAAACEPAVLVPVIQKKYGAAGVDHLVCLAPNAILTVKTGGDDTVAFLAQKDGAWTIVAEGPTGNVEQLTPKDFPLSLVRSWEDKRNPAPPTSASTGRKPVTTDTIETRNGKVVCRGEGGDITTCPSTTAPATTTTRPPTTKAPTTTEAPTPPPTPPTTFSQHCIENPLDPACTK